MDPICVATRLKKIKQKPVIISVGPPKPPPPAPGPPGPEVPKHVCKPPYCNNCDVVSITTYESGSGCTIL
ncbi:Heavy metal-associated isoprenylated plant protein 43 [Cardamine amara subsp. amara]|uniref:Heavy metal-associated isoprenylated plant protein 43 n=1 Tax=Cardamine amara subsp. amara TaxID=228776 RepID=A0ABD1AYH4_CARAN